MNKITVENLQFLFGLTFDKAAAWLIPINQTLTKYSILTPNQIAMFLAQVGHESGKLSAVKENLNYSAVSLVKTWPTRFNATTAAKYARKPEAIANKVYAGRFGNGDEASGDGFKYRGRGLIQVTFKDNYRECGKALGLDLVASPELLETPLYAVMSAGWYWDSRKLNDLADKGDILAVTKKINGGTHGLEDRTMLYKRAKQFTAV